MIEEGRETEPAPLGVEIEVLRRAKNAVAAMRGEYLAWLRQDVVRLDSLLRDAWGPGAGSAIEGMMRIAHDMRGQGGTFGFPLVSEVAGSLCRLLRRSATRMAGEETSVDLALAVRHLAAVRLMLDGGSDDDSLRDLVTGLQQAVAERGA